MSAKKESIITRVQKLLNLAMDEGATPDERKLAQERADRLMVEHMIEQSELKKDDPSRSRATSVTWKMNMGNEFRNATEQMLASIVKHAQCRYRVKIDFSDVEHRHHVIIVGLPEQIAYAERLWFIAFTEMARNISPKWDERESFDTNVYAFVKAGMKWRQIHEIAWTKLGSLSGLPDPYPADKQTPWAKTYCGDGGRLKRALKREQFRLGEENEHHTNRHSAYRSSYVSGYTATIGRRLREMASASKESVADADKYALAVRSTAEQADAEFYRLFPEFDPENIRKASAAAQAAEMARRAAMTQAQRDAEDKRQKAAYRSARAYYGKLGGNKSYDSNGYARGDKVAKSVNLNDNKAAGERKKEIG